MTNREFLRWPYVVTVVTMAGVLLAGGAFYRSQKIQMRRAAEQQLQAVARLKANQIVAWRADRLADAAMLSESPMTRDAVALVMTNPTHEVTASLRERLQSVLVHRQYSKAVLVDTRGEMRIEVGEKHREFTPETKTAFETALRSGIPVFGDLYSNPDDAGIHLDVVAPIVLNRDETPTPVGAIILQSDARQFLFPLIQAWPLPSRSSETLLVRRDDDKVLFLNELRHKSNTAMRMRIPLTRSEVPAVMSVRGKTGIVFGTDYRGTKVIADIGPLPASNWFMVAKMDIAEAFAEWHTRSLLIIAVILGFMLAFGAAVSMLWQRDHRKHLHQILAEETARKRSEERYRSLYTTMTELVALHELVRDPSGKPVNYRILDCNPVFTTITGIAREKAVGRLATEVYGTTSAPYLDEYARVAETGAPAHFETYFEPMDKHFRVSAFSPAQNQFATVALDISERKRVEREILRTSRLYAVLSAVNQAVVRAGSSDAFLLQACQAIVEEGGLKLGWIGRPDPVTQKVTPVAIWGEAQEYIAGLEVYADDRPLGQGPTGAAIRERRPCVCNDFMTDPRAATWRDRAGAYGFLAAASFPITTGGSVWGALTIYSGEPGFFGDKEIRLLAEAATDIGFALENAERERQRWKAEEEKDLMQAQLFQSQKMESIGRLAGGVAHDFNNMLQVIMGSVTLALERVPAGGPLADELTEVLRAAERSVDLTRQLLAFSRKQTFRPILLDLNETIGSALNMLRRLIGEGVELSWLPADTLGAVRMDPAQVSQVLTNLVVNSRDAIRGSGRIVITTANEEMDRDRCLLSNADCVPGSYVTVTVSDTGHGIDPATLPHIFEPFFTTKGQGKGTGLGLATVYGIVRQNNGFVEVCSEPGRGAIFKIYIPRHDDKPVPAAAPPRSATPAGSATVLLVEDEKQVLDLVHRILEREGYTVLVAGDPKEALELISRHAGRLDLLVTDVVMPGMNGKELEQKIRQAYPDIVCLFISGYTRDTIAQHGVLDEGIHFLQKPFSPNDLALRVREALAHLDP